jgi:MFS family permease
MRGETTRAALLRRARCRRAGIQSSLCTRGPARFIIAFLDRRRSGDIFISELPKSFRGYIVTASSMRLASTGLSVLLGYHLYTLTHDPFTLGWLGLIQALPAVGLMLFGGVVADRFSRQSVALVCRAIFAGLCLVLAGTTLLGDGAAEAGIYVVAFLGGITNAFAQPANQGLDSDELPDSGTVRAASVLSSAVQAAMLSGPVVASFLFDLAGAPATYAILAAGFAFSALQLVRAVPPRPPLYTPGDGMGIGAKIAEGLRFVFAEQLLLGPMALDLFAVFFGGAVALLPAFASDILHVGPVGFGFLRSAMAGGSLLAMLTTVRHPPREHAGLMLLCVVGGFGVAMIAFAFSTNFYLSFAALAVAGGCDGVSLVIRRIVARFAVPEALRGRISAVRMVFVNSSNELGDFESGMLAGALGIVPAVWIGGAIALGVVAFTAWRAPKLRRLDLVELEQQAATQAV